jgi:hypothetical protein
MYYIKRVKTGKFLSSLFTDQLHKAFGEDRAEYGYGYSDPELANVIANNYQRDHNEEFEVVYESAPNVKMAYGSIKSFYFKD